MYSLTIKLAFSNHLWIVSFSQSNLLVIVSLIKYSFSFIAIYSLLTNLYEISQILIIITGLIGICIGIAGLVVIILVLGIIFLGTGIVCFKNKSNSKMIIQVSILL